MIVRTYNRITYTMALLHRPSTLWAAHINKTIVYQVMDVPEIQVKAPQVHEHSLATKKGPLSM